jgi:hypothetical protein
MAGARRLQRRREAEGDAGDERHDEREGEHAPGPA